MSHKRLVQLIQAHQKAREAGQEPSMAHETIMSILRGVEKGDITKGRALRLLPYQAARLAEEPAHAALYRQAAADICQMQREEH